MELTTNSLEFVRYLCIILAFVSILIVAFFRYIKTAIFLLLILASLLFYLFGLEKLLEA